MSRCENVDRVSSEWFSRPDDDRYLSLDDLFASVKARAEQTFTDSYTLELGGLTFEIVHPGQAHTPGDSFV